MQGVKKDLVYEWFVGNHEVYVWLRVTCSGRVASVMVNAVEYEVTIKYDFDTEVSECKDSPDVYLELLNRLEVKLATLAIIDRLRSELRNQNSGLGC